jgi:hypothetical protein
VECGCRECAGPQLLTCQIVLVPRRLGVFPIHAAQSRCTFGRAPFLVCSRTWTDAAAYTKPLRWALFTGTLIRVPRCGRGHRYVCALRVLGMCVRSGAWIGIDIGIGTHSCACVRGYVPIHGVGFYSGGIVPSFLLRSFYHVPATDAPLGLLRVRSTMLLRWMDGCVLLSVFCFWLLRPLSYAVLVFTSASWCSLYPSISWICFFWMNCIVSFAL